MCVLTAALDFFPEEESTHFGAPLGSWGEQSFWMLGAGGCVPGIPGATPRRWLAAPMCKGPALQAAALAKDLSRAWPQRQGRKTGAGRVPAVGRGLENRHRESFSVFRYGLLAELNSAL